MHLLVVFKIFVKILLNNFVNGHSMKYNICLMHSNLIKIQLIDHIDSILNINIAAVNLIHKFDMYESDVGKPDTALIN